MLIRHASAAGMLLAAVTASAQSSLPDGDSTVAAGYVSRHTTRLERYATRVERQHDRLLKRLSRREGTILVRLRRTDSAAAARLAAGTSFDSLRRRHTLGPRARSAADAAVDSLRRIGGFASASAAVPPASSRLDALDARLAVRREGAAAAQARLRELRTAGAGRIPGWQGVEKTAYYTTARLRAWRAVADQPSKAEEKALELLQGTEGFSEALARAGAPGSALPGAPGGSAAPAPATAADLEKLGFQTRRQVQASLQQQFGPSLDGVQKGLGQQVADWQQGLKAGQAALGQARTAAKDARATVREAGQAAKGISGIQKPSFRVNPMRGLPLYQRLEKGYTLNASRAAAGKPALLDGGYQVAFRHTPSVSYGLGVLASLGLGQDWNHIRFSAEGLGGRAFAQWKGPYGFGAYGGYERTYRLARFSQVPEGRPLPETPHANGRWAESLLLGATKSYRINARWSGTAQLLFDPWWQTKNSSPFTIRFTSTQ